VGDGAAFGALGADGRLADEPVVVGSVTRNAGIVAPPRRPHSEMSVVGQMLPKQPRNATSDSP
jgi:hypothetical protein